MGAYNFGTYSMGETAKAAFSAAVSEARYMHGHGGYTGTIAEKHDYVELTLPPRLDHVKAVEMIEKASYLGEGASYTKERLAALLKTKAVRGQGEWRAREIKELKSTIRESERFWKNLKPEHRELVEDAADLYGDKWGPALCFTLTGTAAARVKERAGRKGKRGLSVYYFFGLASS